MPRIRACGWGRSQELAVEHAGQDDIVGEAGLPRHLRASIDAPPGYADNRVGSPVHGSSPRSRDGSVRRGASSRRLSPDPVAQRQDCGFDRFEDLQVAGTAAQSAGESLTNLVARRTCDPVEQRFGGDQNGRRAVAALRSAQDREGFLQRVEFSLARQPLDGVDLAPVALESQDQTREDGFSVKQHGTGSALAQFAAVLGSGEPEILPEDFKQCLVRGKRRLDIFPVQTKRNGGGQVLTPLRFSNPRIR